MVLRAIRKIPAKWAGTPGQNADCMRMISSEEINPPNAIWYCVGGSTPNGSITPLGLSATFGNGSKEPGIPSSSTPPTIRIYDTSSSAIDAITLHAHSRLDMDAAGRLTIRDARSFRVPSHSCHSRPAMAFAISDTQRRTAEIPAASRDERGYAAG